VRSCLQVLELPPKPETLPGEVMTATPKTRAERHAELRRLAASPNGLAKLYAILARGFIPFAKLPIGTLMIEAILDHECPVVR
jgi:hypothetical protein